MSILIRGMEMPKNCMECDFFEQFTSRGFFGPLGYCMRTKEEINVIARGLDCPLVELPLHGRLGDLDDLQRRINTLRINAMADGIDVDPYWHCLDAILQTKTVIPAKEAKE